MPAEGSGLLFEVTKSVESVEYSAVASAVFLWAAIRFLQERRPATGELNRSTRYP